MLFVKLKSSWFSWKFVLKVIRRLFWVQSSEKQEKVTWIHFPFYPVCFFPLQKAGFPSVSSSLAYHWVNQLRYSDKSSKGFFLKSASSSWIILSISFDKLVMNSLEMIFILLLHNNFYMVKNIGGFLGKLTDYFLNIIVNVNFFSVLKFEYY